jgi:hypothetical protein
MRSLFSFKRPVLIVLAALTMAAITCGPFGPRETPTPEPSGPGFADYGDAPDGDNGMDTGYYGFTGGPFVFTLNSMGVPASFPTAGDDPVPGPYTLDVDEFYIGPLIGGATASDIPSLEDDVFDPNDPDGPPNLNNAKADCDKENGTHNPSGTGCQPVPPYSIPMNGRLSIVFGFPPLGVFITSVTVSDTVNVEGPAYWNFLVDINQDGRWGQGEWVAQDVPVNLVPGTTQTLISPAFRLGTSGAPWGRINLPFWARSMVTLDRMRDTFGTNWDGRGVDGGFSHGEVEDYFIEWQPLGQRFPGGGGGGAGGDGETQCGPELMTSFSCPETIDVGTTMSCDFEMPVEELFIACVPNNESGINLAEFGSIQAGEESVQICDGDGFNLMGSFVPGVGLALDLYEAPEAAQIVISASGNEMEICGGVGLTLIEYARMAEVGRWAGASEMNIFGLWLMDSGIVSDGSNHGPRIGMQDQLELRVSQNSIHFEGDPPFVSVDGELNDDGSFYAEGHGTVAGFPNIAVTFEGQFSDGTLSGQYTMGADGGLPTGEPIIYGLTGTFQGPLTEGEEETPAPSPLPEGVTQTIDEFIQVFNQAFAEGDASSLYQLLHPAVFDVYGEEACQTYLENVVSNTIQIELVDAWFEGPWDWVIDDITTPLDYIYTIVANRTFEGDTAEIELHLYMPGDDSVRWLTDCGEPLE